ncbi:MAG: hypothetical protein EPN22_16995 [Nitrospirae bacterium]|nr:MAG: hypothetical protein EPN22_16995 [Nitrospirota bacterium]
MVYRLRSGIENFQVVDGPFKGRRYEKGKNYDAAEIPPQEKNKFEAVKEKVSEPSSAPVSSETQPTTKKERIGR